MSSTAITLTRARRRCALVFFGIDRRLDLTGPAIAENVLVPASALFNVISAGFLWAPGRIENPRSGEAAQLAPPRLDCLPPGDYRCESPLDPTDEPLYYSLAAFGDYWGDGFHSLSNVIFQLESLRRATDMALAQAPDIAVFLRPDLLYLDHFAATLKWAAAAEGPLALVPHWQPHGGLNDRFAICIGRPAIMAYGHRIEMALDFCERNAHPLHSEKLLRYALKQSQIPVRRIAQRASRVRVDGHARDEDFSYRGWKPALRGLAGWLRRTLMLSLPDSEKKT